ncbi:MULTISPECIES: hypothetical protein [unclassified Cryobacterium]|uniref:hypothetical protein n=1 Tax=unclassified Cryobacterium TaxID=2649013 RepID=UPI002AB4A293|nr:MULTISPECIES: hypothetical protein [unclassified Cryobacterium]MDY7542137.1 hypothetical protein [Cryobacterium sp. 5B3]MEB0265859.1 hypothetical protein [Cryobacterium sp. 10I5]MEB0275946.1 hypothetical protein [Cryobacterium sp. 5B3]
MPLFMDVDGGLCALPVYLGAVWPLLERVELDAPEPYPSHVWVNPAAVTALNELIDDGLVRPIWCTSWDDAANFLIPALGLHGGAWPVATLGTREGGLIREDIWIKTEAVSRVVADQRFVMVDDFLGDPGDRPLAAPRRSMEITFGAKNMLLIGTRPERGLTVDDVARIREFIEKA